MVKATTLAALAKPAEAAETAVATAPPVGGNAAMIARYGNRLAPPQAVAAAPRPVPQQDPTAVAKKLFADASGKPAKSLPDFSSEGTWVRSADKYVLTSKKSGSDEIHEASLTEAGRLVIPLPELKLTLYFVRAI